MLLAALWEGRNLVSDELPEDTLNNLMPSLMQGKQKRQYLLSPNVRLELAIGVVTVTIAALVGAL